MFALSPNGAAQVFFQSSSCCVVCPVWVVWNAPLRRCNTVAKVLVIRFIIDNVIIAINLRIDSPLQQKYSHSNSEWNSGGSFCRWFPFNTQKKRHRKWVWVKLLLSRLAHNAAASFWGQPCLPSHPSPLFYLFHLDIRLSMGAATQQH